MSSAGLTWLVLSWVLQPAPTPKEEEEEEGEGEVKEESPERVKAEPEDDGPSGELINVKEEERGSLLQSYPPAGDDAGQGSGLESAEAGGVQKRRSHLTEDDH